MVPGPEVQVDKAQELRHWEGKIPLWPTTTSDCTRKCPLKAGVRVSQLPPMSSWPQGAILATADLDHFFQLQQPAVLGFTYEFTKQSAEITSWSKSFTKEMSSW